MCRRRPVIWPALVACLLLLTVSCRRAGPVQVVEKQVTVQVVETRLAISVVTRVVTPAPTATPAYVARHNAPPDTLVYPIAAEPQSLDPQVAVDEAAILTLHQLYETLFDVRADGSVVPAAATAYRSSADGQTYTVTLRTGLTWSTGEPVTAQQYVDGLCRLLDPASGNRNGAMLARATLIRGAAAYAAGELAGCDGVAVRAGDARTLHISLERPVGNLVELLAYPYWWPAPPAATGEFPVAPVGNGPYVLSEGQAGERLVLTRNARYWDAANVPLGRVELRVAPNVGTQRALYERGDLAAVEIGAADLGQLLGQAQRAAEIKRVSRPGTSYLVFDVRSGPSSDARYRRAVASALERGVLPAAGAPGRPAVGLLPPGPAATPNAQPANAPDVAAAQALLAAAGYSAQRPPAVLDVGINREGSNLALADVLLAPLEKAGIPARLISSPWNVYAGALQQCAGAKATCPYRLLWVGWVMEYADPGTLLEQAAGYAGWQNPAFGALLTRARAEVDPGWRATLYADAERMLLDEAVVIPLLHYERAWLVKKGVAYEFPAFGVPAFRYWRSAGS